MAFANGIQERQVFSRRRLLASAVLMCSLWTAESAHAGAGPPRRTGTWPRNIVRALQQRLLQLGLNPGPIDGIYGPRTAAAIRQFQIMHGLDPDGRISVAVLERVGLAKTK